MANVNGTLGNDVLSGTEFADVIDGLDGDDVINGGLGADVLNGGFGNDIFRWTSILVSSGSLPIGAVDGGPGYDIVDVSAVSPTSVSSFTLTGFTLSVGSQRFITTNVEEVRFGSGNDYVSLTTAGAIAMRLGGGNDQTFSSVG